MASSTITIPANGAATLPTPGQVVFVGAGPGDVELLTLKALRALQNADVVIHDRLVGADVLALANPSAQLINVGKQGFGPSTDQEHINALIVRHARASLRVARIKGGDCALFARLDEEIDALDAADLPYTIIPGITAASSAVASIGQALTKRGRNASVRLLTGHDTKGFADQDWQALARPGEVAAIYMGLKAARFIQGRMIMHGANPDTPVTIVENASRPDERVIVTSLANLPDALQTLTSGAPALTLFGLAPRDTAISRHTTQSPLLSQELA
ncbi:uroporphyrinogen-III C-methyltransferase [Shimia abyssi]|uniref:uroporphyrinogen-III C-methyltransferase n=1 Tax=Shimia abyssi TaxID=1662395 RepID=A0A2P8FFI5_9RHOB|nr:uroporphyrin-III C-methyltransferase [Shimia abyssi]